ncbi:MAG: helix-turn-helix domain-containing protein [Bacteroides sp.]|nr:helix-turn-helix domain-containing protein [Bacteroides sp.]
MTHDLFIRSMNEEKKQIPVNRLFLLPRGLPCQITSAEANEILIMYIPNITTLYIHFIGEQTTFNYDKMKLFHTLEIDGPLLHIGKSLRLYIEKGILDSVLTGLKALELFHTLRQCYPKETLIELFSPICTKECAFALFVLSHHSKVKTAEELAQLSVYSFSGFNKQFHKVFGISPYKWILQQKVERIYNEIFYETSKPIKLIAEEYGFASLSNLGDFCRKHMGASPAAIRNRKSENI